MSSSTPNTTLTEHNESYNKTSSTSPSYILSSIKSKFQSLKMPNFRMLMTDTFILTWNVVSLITLALPLLAYTVARLTNEQEWNYNNQNGQNGQNNGENQNYYNDNPYANPDNYDEYGNYVGPTHWWQFWKRNNNNGNYNNGEGGEQNNDERRTPWWYVWGEEREGQDPEDQGKGAILFIYIWTVVAIAGLIYLGNSTGMLTNKLEGLRWALVGFANYCFVIMVLLVGLEGGIETEARELEEDGFYGQTAVLLMLTCFFGLIQSIIFIGWTGKRISKNEVQTDKSDGYVNVEYAKSPSPGYQV